MPDTLMPDYCWDQVEPIQVRHGHDEFSYTDGAQVEAELYRRLKTVADRRTGSTEMERLITDWPSRYHFSSLRSNLFRHINIRPGHTILELGAGCGAVSRYMGETGATVTSVEGSVARARIARARCQDLPNISFMCDNFQRLSLGRQHDFVLLIGVLEYAPRFFGGEDPFGQCLRVAFNHLAPNGTLVVAIENQLGLKYFCGAPEDHIGKRYYGIQDRYKPTEARTFGRVELTNLLAGAGLGHAAFNYPFPDYKLPTMMLTEQGCRCPGFEPGELLAQLPSIHEGAPLKGQFEEAAAWPSLARNNLIQDLANSFLVFARRGPGSVPVADDLLAVYYTGDRLPRWRVRTDFVRDASGAITVHKSSIFPDPAGGEMFSQDLRPHPYVRGISMELAIGRCFDERRFADGLEILKKWVEYLVAHGVTKPRADDPGASILRRDYFDCVPKNLLLVEGAIQRIDPEWRIERDIPLYFEVMRGAVAFVNKWTQQLEPFLMCHGRQAQLCKILEILGIRVHEQWYSAFLSYLDNIGREIYGQIAPSRAQEANHKPPRKRRWKDSARDMIRRVIK